MKTIIYYFTGTGNTLAIVRGIAEELGDTKLIPLRRAIHPGGIAPEADAVGIAFPVYFLNMPALVRQFVQNIRFDGNPYIFGIATCGERPGGSLFFLKKLLEENGKTLSAGFVFVMPENYIGPIDLMGDAPHRQDKYTVAKSRIPVVAAAIHDRKITLPEGSDSMLLKIGGSITSTLATSFYNTPGRLHATAACNHCGICGRICPTRNITVTEHGVGWGRECTQCYACIHWCPTGAIEIGGRTKGRQRYHHPDITLRDMLDQRGEI
jgi:ferredoxin/flavodoxin